MKWDESTWDEDLLLNADEQEELEEIAKAWDSEEMVADFNDAIHEAAMLDGSQRVSHSVRRLSLIQAPSRNRLIVRND